MTRRTSSPGALSGVRLMAICLACMAVTASRDLLRVEQRGGDVKPRAQSGCHHCD